MGDPGPFRFDLPHGEVRRTEVELTEQPHLKLGRPRLLPDERLAIVVADLETEGEAPDARIRLKTRGPQNLVHEGHTLRTGHRDTATPLAAVRPDDRQRNRAVEAGGQATRRQQLRAQRDAVIPFLSLGVTRRVDARPATPLDTS